MELLNLEEDIIDKRIVRAVKEMGFKQFSPIQEQSIPEILKGKDVIGQAQNDAYVYALGGDQWL